MLVKGLYKSSDFYESLVFVILPDSISLYLCQAHAGIIMNSGLLIVFIFSLYICLTCNKK